MTTQFKILLESVSGQPCSEFIWNGERVKVLVEPDLSCAIKDARDIALSYPGFVAVVVETQDKVIRYHRLTAEVKYTLVESIIRV